MTTYDADALEDLDDNHEPKCHRFTAHIFDDAIPSEKTICVGHDAWREGTLGFLKPQLTKQELST